MVKLILNTVHIMSALNILLIISILQPFAQLFSKPAGHKAQILCIGVMFC